MIARMPITCPSCGAWSLLGDGDRHLVCGECAHRLTANLPPFFLVTGAAGTGKSAVVPSLRQRLPEVFVVGGDVLLSEARHEFVNRWLRVADAQAQCGRHTLVAGLLLPEELEAAPDRRLVGSVEVLVLDCSDEVREERIRGRKRWAGRGGAALDALVEEHRVIAERLRSASGSRVDTAAFGVSDVVEKVAEWFETVVSRRDPMTASAAPAG